MQNREAKYKRLREEMVFRQLEMRGISDPLVLDAMRSVPRHLFVSEALMDQAYGDYPLPIGEQQTISQPLIVAEMTQAIGIGPDDRVLEIGTGSGYQAAILSRIAFRVYTVERIYSLYARTRKLFDQLQYYNIVTRYSDGTSGWKEESPYDAIVVTAGGPEVPEPLVKQLAVGGKLIIPVGDKYTQELIKVTRTETGVKRESLGSCRFVKLIGEHGWKE
ncbi:protein-L-isoaspartate(D-aspartate) O-methyltransferase [Desulforegula conservatrix]|uniref:protein-L-isoaspartate(D-aspartate) O-methyltransferase n=1 Tax=Desulforegula conservatrix TaxID=153026 RepID=UPI00041C6D59|nr:protein-L-isoaspartate(D-aspartate) O-methyltransferase [Desulforegula conservatrix]